ncbi:hypothetical protein K1719_035879 [Acacia pycnantha]|nr:hypothetical protein K1719_035879 [Acacia pycnantha]
MVSTLEEDLELKTSAMKFQEIFATRTYELATISFTSFKVFKLFPVTGALSASPSSPITPVIEGDLLNVYNSFRFFLKLTPNILSGSVVHWTLEYEKPSNDTPDPTSLMKELIRVSKDVDAFVGSLI